MPVAAVAEWSKYRIVAGLVKSSRPVPLKTCRVRIQCKLNLSRAQTSFRWCSVVFRRGGYQLRCRPRHLTIVEKDEVVTGTWRSPYLSVARIRLQTKAGLVGKRHRRPLLWCPQCMLSTPG
ncbi:uncharacterized protein TNCV_4297741 [Trichonephila clavipes]|nr:uncharacterized protein TNCV_4297741 [Trichonephila clavipes]